MNYMLSFTWITNIRTRWIRNYYVSLKYNRCAKRLNKVFQSWVFSLLTTSLVCPSARGAIVHKPLRRAATNIDENNANLLHILQRGAQHLIANFVILVCNRNTLFMNLILQVKFVDATGWWTRYLSFANLVKLRKLRYEKNFLDLFPKLFLFCFFASWEKPPGSNTTSPKNIGWLLIGPTNWFPQWPDSCFWQAQTAINKNVLRFQVHTDTEPSAKILLGDKGPNFDTVSILLQWNDFYSSFVHVKETFSFGKEL